MVTVRNSGRSPHRDLVCRRTAPATWEVNGWWRTDVPADCYRTRGYSRIAWELGTGWMVQMRMADLEQAVRHGRVRPKGRRRLIRLNPVMSLVQADNSSPLPVPMLCHPIHDTQPRALSRWEAGVRATVLNQPEQIGVRRQSIRDRWIGSWRNAKGARLAGRGTPPALVLQTPRRLIAVEFVRCTQLGRGIHRLQRCLPVLQRTDAVPALILVTDGAVDGLAQAYWRELMDPPIELCRAPAVFSVTAPA